MVSAIRLIDRLSGWVGKAFAWCILIMSFGVGFEVFSRYLLNAPTGWAYDLSYMMYGTLFMMGGAYTLSRDGMVRGDFLYRLWPPRTQAWVELSLYFLFFYPGMLALAFAGWKYASRSISYSEVSVMSPAGMPIYQFKTILVAAAALMLVQGVAQVLRCIWCIRTGEWLKPEDDIEELEDVILRKAAAEGHQAEGQEFSRSLADDVERYRREHGDTEIK